VGRNLLTVSIDLHRHVRFEVCGNELRPCLYGESNGGVAGALCNQIRKVSGSWDQVFQIAAGTNILAAILAIAFLKPRRARVVARSNTAS
jgi:hypothetical protein